MLLPGQYTHLGTNAIAVDNVYWLCHTLYENVMVFLRSMNYEILGLKTRWSCGSLITNANIVSYHRWTGGSLLPNANIVSYHGVVRWVLTYQCEHCFLSQGGPVGPY